MNVFESQRGFTVRQMASSGRPPTFDRREIRRRLRAARAYAEFKSPAALAADPLVKRYGIPGSRIMHTEGMRRDVELWELEVIARACGLPPAFFTVDFSRLDELDESAG